MHILRFSQLTRSTVRTGTGDGRKIGQYRISKSAKFPEEEQSKVLTNVEKRVGHMSDLTMRGGEMFQVANYGIGGHYEPHFDHVTDESVPFKELGLGNRIATALFYVRNIYNVQNFNQWNLS